MKCVFGLVVPCLLLAVGCGQSVEITLEGDDIGSNLTTEPVVFTAPADFNPDGLPTVEMAVPDLHCDGCAEQCHKLLVEQPGVAEVVVDFPSRTALVAYTGEFEQQVAISSVQEYYPNSTVKPAE